MAVYRFRITFEEHEEIHRDIEIKSTQTLEELHFAILQSIHFDTKHNASFFISDDYWRKGKEFVAKNEENRDKNKPAPEKNLMSKSKLAALIDDPHQRFVYVYDYSVAWTFLIELTKILSDNPKVNYPLCAKAIGTAPKQYNEILIPKTQVEEEEFEDDDELDSDDEAYEVASSAEDVELLDGEEGEEIEEEESDVELEKPEEDFEATEFNDNEHLEDY
jgi:Plasmid pRiA4b ORF-3-like protein